MQAATPCYIKSPIRYARRGCPRFNSHRGASAGAVLASLRRDTTLPACSYAFTIRVWTMVVQQPNYLSHRVGNKAECPKEQTHQLGSPLSNTPCYADSPKRRETVIIEKTKRTRTTWLRRPFGLSEYGRWWFISVACINGVFRPCILFRKRLLDSTHLVCHSRSRIVHKGDGERCRKGSNSDVHCTPTVFFLR